MPLTEDEYSCLMSLTQKVWDYCDNPDNKYDVSNSDKMEICDIVTDVNFGEIRQSVAQMNMDLINEAPFTWYCSYFHNKMHLYEQDGKVAIKSTLYIVDVVDYHYDNIRRNREPSSEYSFEKNVMWKWIDNVYKMQQPLADQIGEYSGVLVNPDYEDGFLADDRKQLVTRKFASDFDSCKFTHPAISPAMSNVIWKHFEHRWNMLYCEYGYDIKITIDVDGSGATVTYN